MMSPWLGLPDDVVQVCPYTSTWRLWYRWEWLKLWLRLGLNIQDVQHIGSTAIPGMVAKPIIDIAVAVAAFERAFRLVGPIEQLGFTYQGENSELRCCYFIKGSPLTHNLYVMERQSTEWENKIRFRDYLIQHPDIAQSYADLKRRLAAQFSSDLQAYQRGKLAFVQQVLQKAT